MRRLHSLLLLLAAGLVLGAFDAQACSCHWPPEGREGAKKMLETSAAVFRGQVVRAEQRGGAILLTFRVSKAWKGPSSPFIDVATPIEESMCGLGAKVGTEYVVFAYWTGKDDWSSSPLFTTVCEGTNPVDYMQSRFPERHAFFEETPDLHERRDREALHGGGCASCAATGQGFGILPFLVLFRLIRRRAAKPLSVFRRARGN
jgi:hypothetical protein